MTIKKSGLGLEQFVVTQVGNVINKMFVRILIVILIVFFYVTITFSGVLKKILQFLFVQTHCSIIRIQKA